MSNIFVALRSGKYLYKLIYPQRNIWIYSYVCQTLGEWGGGLERITKKSEHFFFFKYSWIQILFLFLVSTLDINKYFLFLFVKMLASQIYSSSYFWKKLTICWTLLLKSSCWLDGWLVGQSTRSRKLFEQG